MSGHSKWANIKNRKGAQDKKRSEAFTKVSKNILTAVRQGGGNTNVEANSYLKVAVEKAREVNMPKDNIQRLLERFELRKANLITATFEGFGPRGVPIIIEVETDNKNRTLGEIRLIFKVNGGNLGEEGSLQFLFDRVGEIELNELNEEQELELIDMGVKDIEERTVLTEAGDLKRIVELLTAKEWKINGSQIVMRAKNPVELKSEEELEEVMEMIDQLEENDDVVNVFAGFDYHEQAV